MFFTRKIFVFLLFLFVLGAEIISAQQPKKKVFVINIMEEIAPPIAFYVDRAIDEAENENVDYILVQIHTYGGLLHSADEISTKILHAKPTTIAFINNNAFSAGAMISIACDSIVMVPDGRIGAATAVTPNMQVAPEKIQSGMRGMMRSIAETNHRDPTIAEDMVGTYVDSVTAKRKVITFTASEAYENNYCDLIVNNMDEILRAYHLQDAEIIYYESSFIEKIIRFLKNPMVSGILILIIMAGIYFEFQHPGTMFPIIVAAAAAGLYFAPLYLEGLAQAWEILIFVVGVVLLIIEIFFIPGFGFIGALGIGMIIFGLSAALLENVDFDFSHVKRSNIARALLTVLGSMLAAIALIIVLMRYYLKDTFGLFRRLSVVQSESKTEGFSSHPSSESLIGKTGTCVSDLRPAGIAEIEGEKYDVMTRGNYITKGSKVKVISAEGSKIIVTQSE